MQRQKQTSEAPPTAAAGVAFEERGQSQPVERPELSQLLHDLNQPLSAIHNYAQAGKHLLDAGPADPARMKELFDKISGQCTRATALSRALGDTLRAAATGKNPD